jgi:hypothetical protein
MKGKSLISTVLRIVLLIVKSYFISFIAVSFASFLPNYARDGSTWKEYIEDINLTLIVSLFGSIFFFLYFNQQYKKRKNQE